jgi:hypothetical protein
MKNELSMLKQIQEMQWQTVINQCIWRIILKSYCTGHGARYVWIYPRTSLCKRERQDFDDRLDAKGLRMEGNL